MVPRAAGLWACRPGPSWGQLGPGRWGQVSCSAWGRGSRVSTTLNESSSTFPVLKASSPSSPRLQHGHCGQSQVSHNKKLYHASGRCQVRKKQVHSLPPPGHYDQEVTGQSEGHISIYRTHTGLAVYPNPFQFCLNIQADGTKMTSCALICSANDVFFQKQQQKNQVSTQAV